jgi:hypothetical protein
MCRRDRRLELAVSAAFGMAWYLHLHILKEIAEASAELAALRDEQDTTP